MSSPEPKTIRASMMESTSLVLPADTNSLGTIFGGRLMALVDLAAATAATRHARCVVVTASIDELHFLAPVRTGDILILRAAVNGVGSSSMEVGVRVEKEDPMTGQRVRTASAYLTFVALDDHGHPHAVPPLIAESDDDHRRVHNAALRRARRLEGRELYRRKESGSGA